jgi:hypothetical protein
MLEAIVHDQDLGAVFADGLVCAVR